MPEKRCGFGFSCAAMQLQPGLEAGDCPNYATCGSAYRLTPDEEVELFRVRQEEQRRILERIPVSRRSAAVMMLMARGNPRSLENFNLIEGGMAAIEGQIEELRSRLEQFTADCYIAPDNCEAHRYNVKRPKGVYWYNKLTAIEAIFEPSEKQERVKVIHLSHDDDPRNFEGRMGIERRDRLHQIENRLRAAEEILGQAIALVNAPLEFVLADDRE